MGFQAGIFLADDMVVLKGGGVPGGFDVGSRQFHLGACDAAIGEKVEQQSIHGLGAAKNAFRIMLGGVVEVRGVVVEKQGRKGLHGTERGTEVMGNGVNEGLQLSVGLDEFGGAFGDALFEVFIGAGKLLVGVLQGLLGVFAAGNIAGDFRSADDFLLSIPERRDGKGDVDESAILTLANGLIVFDPFSTANAADNL